MWFVQNSLFLVIVHKNVATRGMKRFNLEAQCGGCANLINDINDLASFYHRQRIMEDEARFCEENNYRYFSLHRTIDVRWTASAFRSLLGVFENWPFIVQHLQEMLADTSGFDKDTRKKIASLLEILLNKNFILLLALGKYLLYFHDCKPWVQNRLARNHNITNNKLMSFCVIKFQVLYDMMASKNQKN